MANATRPLASTPGTEPELGPGPIPAGSLPEKTAVQTRQPAKNPANPVLNQAAERVGRIIGTAVERVRELPERVVEARERFMVVKGRTSEDASATAAEWKQAAQQKLRQGRSRAQQLADEQPLYVIAGAAGIAFVLGFALRIWRSTNAHS